MTTERPPNGDERCPRCGHPGARASKTQPGARYCPTCNHLWTPAVTTIAALELARFVAERDA